MKAKRTFQVPGEARVMFTTLPPDVDLQAAFPLRLLVTRSETRAVWMAKPGRYALLIVDERTADNRRGLVLALAFETDAASLAVFADVAGRFAAATVRDEARRLAGREEPWYPPYPRPMPPCPPRRPRPRPVPGEPVYDILPVPPFVPVPEPTEPTYHILPVPPFVPVPEPKASARRFKSLPHGAGRPSGAEDQTTWQ